MDGSPGGPAPGQASRARGRESEPDLAPTKIGRQGAFCRVFLQAKIEPRRAPALVGAVPPAAGRLLAALFLPLLRLLDRHAGGHLARPVAVAVVVLRGRDLVPVGE